MNFGTLDQTGIVTSPVGVIANNGTRYFQTKIVNSGTEDNYYCISYHMV